MTTVAGAEALRGVFKYRSPVPASLGMYYAGILFLLCVILKALAIKDL